MIVTALLILFSTLAVWDTIRRLLPVHVPGVIARVMCFGIALTILSLASPHVLLAMSAVGGLMLLANYVTVEPVKPWGVYLTWAWHRVHKPKVTEPGHEARPDSQLGNRIPSL